MALVGQSHKLTVSQNNFKYLTIVQLRSHFKNKFINHCVTVDVYSSTRRRIDCCLSFKLFIADHFEKFKTVVSLKSLLYTHANPIFLDNHLPL